ncbi:MAG: phosphoribosyltransferase [Bacillota bacterium]
MYTNRADAGRQLALRLAGREFHDALVVSIPRGGVEVGAELAAALRLPLDIIIPRKIGAPFNPELAIGAVTQDGTAIFNDRLVAQVGLAEEDKEKLVAGTVAEINRRMCLYRGDRPPVSLAGREIILTDDGIATGYTVLAALRSIRKSGPERIILAVPVAPEETIETLLPDVDEMVCLSMPYDFMAVGQFYLNFKQTTDAEVIDLLRKNYR